MSLLAPRRLSTARALRQISKRPARGGMTWSVAMSRDCVRWFRMALTPLDDAVPRLLAPTKMFTRAEVLTHPSPVPASAGVYAWYFDKVPDGVPVEGCRTVDGHTLLYVGISPKKPSADGLKTSRQSVRTRVRYHFRGNAYGSTLRLTLGSLLALELGLQLRRVGSGKRLTFSAGEGALSEWMECHARVCWMETSTPWLLEHDLISKVFLPLNLDQNRHSPFREELSAIRGEQRKRARSLPALPR